MNSEKMKMGGFVLGKFRQTAGMAKPWAGLIGVMLICASAYVAAGQGGDPGVGQRTNPQLTVNDLAGCKDEIAKFHQMQINYMKDYAQDYCTKGNQNYGLESCKMVNDGVRESSAMSDVSWYVKGNGSCEMTDYPCWGLLDDEKLNRMMADKDISESPTTLGEYGEVADVCVAKLWIAKRDGINPASAAATQSSNELTGNSSPETSPTSTSIIDGGNFSPQQVASCSEEIKNKQIESQSWGGDVNDVAARLGQFQKSLFEGRCAGHPEAQAYIAGAIKMLGYGGSAVGSGKGSLPPLASAGSTSGSGSADRSRSRKIHNPAADAKGCSKLIPSTEWIGQSAMGGNFRFVNNCPTAVEFFWCSDNECTRDSGNTWTISAGGNWPVSGTDVRWGACRGANSGGFDKGSQGLKYICPNLQW
jgi:hypothetical protein